jgi:hypothetical protein
MHPSEFYWLADAKAEQAKQQKRQSGGLTEEEALEMKDELRRARVKAGFPPD